jgi:GMP synthase PP-ATPase subunit
MRFLSQAGFLFGKWVENRIIEVVDEIQWVVYDITNKLSTQGGWKPL